MPHPNDNESQASFDVFLSHNSRNKPAVRELKQRLAATGLTVWFDEDELRPGIPWQGLLEAGIRASKSVVVVVGEDGIGPWEDEEMQGALRLAKNDHRPIIPVLLPGCPTQPDLPLFLGNRTWVDLRDGLLEEGFGKLLWGITGKKPKPGGSVAMRTEPPPLNRLQPQQSKIEKKQEMPATPVLNQVLPGIWQVTIQQPFPSTAMGQLQIEIFPTGQFRGQLMTPMGAFAVKGQWQANPLMNQISFQGMQNNGFQTIPYIVMVQVIQFNERQIHGITNASEQVLWQRLSLPAA